MCNSSSCGHCCGGCGASPSPREAALLSFLAQVSYLPLARFVLVPDGGYPEDGVPILAPVHLHGEGDTLDEVMETAEALVSLANRRLITVDYELPLSGCTYEEYYRSDLFREFTRRFRDHPDGRPVLQRGSFAVTGAGLAYAESLAEASKQA